MKLKTAKYKGTKEWTSFIKAKLSSKLMPRLSLNTFLDDNFSTKLALHEMCAYNQYSESILMKRRLCLQNIPETIINISLKYEYIIFYTHYLNYIILRRYLIRESLYLVDLGVSLL